MVSKSREEMFAQVAGMVTATWSFPGTIVAVEVATYYGGIESREKLGSFEDEFCQREFGGL